jgi:hypothetical protein
LSPKAKTAPDFLRPIVSPADAMTSATSVTSPESRRASANGTNDGNNPDVFLSENLSVK